MRLPRGSKDEEEGAKPQTLGTYSLIERSSGGFTAVESDVLLSVREI